MRLRIFVIFLAGMLFSGEAAADTVTVSAGVSLGDIDLFQGATVTGYSNVKTIFCNVNDAFGSFVGSPEPGSVFAEDGLTLRLEFNPGVQTVNQIVISLGEDASDSGSRAADAVRFYAYIGETWNEVFSEDLGFTYATTYGDHTITVIANLDSAITADAWAFEMDSVSGAGLSGARLFEIDAYNVVPEPATFGLLAGTGLLLAAYRRWFRRV